MSGLDPSATSMVISARQIVVIDLLGVEPQIEPHVDPRDAVTSLSGVHAGRVLIPASRTRRAWNNTASKASMAPISCA
jgi:hypothetical protein